MHVWLNGSFLPAESASVSVFDHGFLYGDGVYETLRTVDNAIFGLQEHWDRLEKSAKLLDMPLPSSAAEIFAATNELVSKNDLESPKVARIRWTLTRGNNEFDFVGSKHPTFLISTVELSPYPADFLESGVSVTTLDFPRLFPAAKTIALLPLILGKQKAAAENVFECLFLDQGNITEGTVSNFFVQVGKEIWTAPQEKVLPGTSAEIFRKKMTDRGFSIQEKFFSAQEVLVQAKSAYLTNALFGVLPVTKLEEKLIGRGKVAEFFSEIQQNFWRA